jgi:hypothetical protein
LPPSCAKWIHLKNTRKCGRETLPDSEPLGGRHGKAAHGSTHRRWQQVSEIPINLVQVELLCRLRRQPDPLVRTALMARVNGIAVGMRNAG